MPNLFANHDSGKCDRHSAIRKIRVNVALFVNIARIIKFRKKVKKEC
jgi:hypothetical protein